MIETLNDSTINMSWASQPLSATGGQIGDQQYDGVRGNYAAGVFTVNAGGADMLCLYDGDPTANVLQTAAVLSGGSTLVLNPVGNQIQIV